jgi:hypothetical protein
MQTMAAYSQPRSPSEARTKIARPLTGALGPTCFSPGRFGLVSFVPLTLLQTERP